MERRSTSVVVFDSGIGGLNLLCACAARAPYARYYYISDSGNVPYGNRPPEEIMRLTLSALSGIEKLGPAALVVACNTVTATCIAELRRRFSFPVVGIQPAVKQAAVRGGKCLVLATNATVKSASFLNLVKSYAPKDTEVAGCENLAAYVEENVLALPDVLPRGLLPEISADSVVLGCTHYAFIKGQIERHYGCPVYDGIEGTASRFSEILGTGDHFCRKNGDFRPLSEKRLKITYKCENIERYKQIMKCLFRNYGVTNKKN
ncbi:MAG: glutamate racemase [Clostridiales bacterium]|nr:glutamate racemase [Clostridiales bacterium]